MYYSNLPASARSHLRHGSEVLQILRHFKLPSLGLVSEVAQFMATMADMDLSMARFRTVATLQICFFLSEQWQCDLMGEFSLSPNLIRSLLVLRALVCYPILQSGLTHSNSLFLVIEGARFQRELRDTLEFLLHGSTNSLAATWNQRASEAVNQNVPM